MKNIEYIKDARLFREVTPSKWAGEPEYIPVMRLKITCGGGMGGASWYEYVHPEFLLPGELVQFTRYDGSEVIINTSYIVTAEKFTLVKATLDISEWEEAANTRTRKGKKEYLVLIDPGKKIELL